MMPTTSLISSDQILTFTPRATHLQRSHFVEEDRIVATSAAAAGALYWELVAMARRAVSDATFFMKLSSMKLFGSGTSGMVPTTFMNSPMLLIQVSTSDFPFDRSMIFTC